MIRHLVRSIALISLTSLCFWRAADVSAAGTVQISSDPFSNPPPSQHLTEVEPQIYSNGSTLVAAFQQGRYPGGGSSDIGFTTSTDSGLTWQHGSLPGITVWVGGDRYESVSDPSVAYDAAFGVWLIESLPVGFGNREIFVSRSGDGLNWDNPIAVYSGSGSYDKPWITCDNSSSISSGNCYIEWEDVAAGNRILMTTSTDGGATWSLPMPTADRATGLGGQPLVQPTGRVVVPYTTYSEIRAFISDDGGSSWSSSIGVAPIHHHPAAGGLRDFNLPSAAVDADGTIYVVWSDCRFRTSCRANDVVLTSSIDGLEWSPVTRVPIDDTSSAADHLLPGIGADRNSYAPDIGLALVYYYYPEANCSTSTCQLTAGFMTSIDGGASWSDPSDLSGPMSLNWLPSTISGLMVGDYFSVFYTNDGVSHPAFAVAAQPVGTFLESMFSICVDCPGTPWPAPGTRVVTASEPVAARQPATAQSDSGALRIIADASRVNIGTQLPLDANGSAVRNAAVEWSVEEGESGGSVSSSGVYTAPITPGTYHVVASSGSERARLAVEVFTVR